MITTMFSVTEAPLYREWGGRWRVDYSGVNEQAWTDDEVEARAVFAELKDLPKSEFETELACGPGPDRMGGRGYTVALHRVTVEVFDEDDEDELERELLESVSYTYDDWCEGNRVDDGEEG